MKLKTLLSIGIIIFFSGCAAMQPLPKTTEARLNVFPADKLDLESDVTLYWNKFQVPYISAKSDSDLAYTLGMVNAHLRLGQMMLMKHVAYGRLSELVGPFTNGIDRGLRTVNFAKSAEANIKRLPSETRIFMERFVQGINNYMATLKKLPPDFSLMGMEKEPFTLKDIMVMGRLAGADVNWLAYATLLKSRKNPNWPTIWNQAMDSGVKMQGFSTGENRLFEQLINTHTKAGSNSIAIGPAKTATHAPILAGDPHVGMSQPNLWLIVGLKSPSFHVVGFMIPGLPFIGLGRNPHIAWSGTHMRAGSSELYDVSHWDEANITSRTETIKNRFWFDKEITIRESSLGPIISDVPMLDPKTGEMVVLKWLGHGSSDEFTALLSANRATSKEAFRASFENYAVSGQNYLFATKEEIGYIPAVKLPIRTFDTPEDLVLNPEKEENRWQGYENTMELPWILNPKEGYIASANNPPYPYKTRFGFYYTYPERLKRLKSLIENHQDISLNHIKTWQTDTYSQVAKELSLKWSTLLDKAGYVKRAEALKAWDGYYREDSQGALLFETLTFYLWEMTVEQGIIDDAKVYKWWNYLGAHFHEDVNKALENGSAEKLNTVMEKTEEQLKEYRTWGDIHRLKIQHPLGNVPLVGSFFQYAQYPIAGSRETLMKSNHSLEIKPHYVTYGSQSRHIFLMDDINENYFVLLGGQDGWLGSENYMDQVPLWRNREYFRMPLEESEIQKSFSHVMELHAE